MISKTKVVLRREKKERDILCPVDDLPDMAVYLDGDGDICMRVGDYIVLLEESSPYVMTIDDISGEALDVLEIYPCTITVHGGGSL